MYCLWGREGKIAGQRLKHKPDCVGASTACFHSNTDAGSSSSETTQSGAGISARPIQSSKTVMGTRVDAGSLAQVCVCVCVLNYVCVLPLPLCRTCHNFCTVFLL